MYADLELMVQDFKYIRTLCDVEPWRTGVHREIDPGPECQTDEQIRGAFPIHAIVSVSLKLYDTDWIKDWQGTTWRMWHFYYRCVSQAYIFWQTQLGVVPCCPGISKG